MSTFKGKTCDFCGKPHKVDDKAAFTMDHIRWEQKNSQTIVGHRHQMDICPECWAKMFEAVGFNADDIEFEDEDSLNDITRRR